MLSLKLLYDSPLASLITGWKRRRMGNVVVPAEEDATLHEDPLRSSYARSIPRALLYKGILMQGYMVVPDVLFDLEKMDIREDDVFVITYPKSGTTWTEEIISLIYNGGDVRKVQKQLLIYRVHHLEVGRPIGHLRFLKNLKSPRLMATHLPWALIPRALRQAKCKVIYVVRNPKDTAVSYYHHHKMSTFLGNYSGTWNEFLAHFMAGHLVYGSWFEHVLEYWKFCQENPENVLFISYEELKIDLKGMVKRLCDFLGREIPESSVDAICKHCSFEEMKTNSMVNREKLPISDFFDMTKSKFMRKGIIGDWKNYFSQEQSESFDEYFNIKMRNGPALVFEPEEAMKRMFEHGRIIVNHPKVSKKPNSETLDNECNSTEEDKLLPDHLEEYSAACHVIPSMQVHMQPDPLMVDFSY